MKVLAMIPVDQLERYAVITCVCKERGVVLYWHDAVGKPVRCPNCGRDGFDLTVGPSATASDLHLPVWDGIAMTF